MLLMQVFKCLSTRTLPSEAQIKVGNLGKDVSTK